MEESWLKTDLPEDVKKEIDKLAKPGEKEALSKKALESYMEMQIAPGEAIGIVTAQSLGEPGTQMTMRTMHHVGIAELNVTLGLPRIIEILDAKQNPKTPAMDVALIDPYNKDKTAAEKVANKIRQVTLEEVAEKFTVDLANFSLLIKLNKEALSRHFTTAKDVEAMLSKARGMSVKLDGQTIVIKPSSEDIMAVHKLKESVKNVYIAGVKGITHVLPVRRGEEFIIQTFGTNLKDVFALDEVDDTRTTSNSLFEVVKVLGIEAARQTVVNELAKVLDSQGLPLDVRHLELIADALCQTGDLLGVTRFGITRQKSSVLARASFEIPLDHLIEASIMGEADKLTSVVENIMINQPIPVGTGLPELVVKMKPGKDFHTKAVKSEKGD